MSEFLFFFYSTRAKCPISPFVLLFLPITFSSIFRGMFLFTLRALSLSKYIKIDINMYFCYICFLLVYSD
uniref:Uncharacterized protein n=1 Tax=Anguilla anguilla TaxID=7936 RepID=A0A0E9UWU4_ANGAN